MLPDSNIALDCLKDCKATVVDLTKAILEASNQNLRQTLIQMRNKAEQDQVEIYHIAERTGGYMSASPADHQQINRVNSFYQQWGRQPVQFNQMVNNQVNQANNNVVSGVGTTSYSTVDPLKSQYSHY